MLSEAELKKHKKKEDDEEWEGNTADAVSRLGKSATKKLDEEDDKEHGKGKKFS